MENNLVVFKGNKDGIKVIIDNEADFSVIKEAFGDKFTEAREFFGSKKTAFKFSGRDLSEAEELELIEIIKNKTDIILSFVSTDYFVENKVVKEKKVEPTLQQMIDEENNLTYFHRGSLRSGKSIKRNSSVVLIGDVNSGAEIIAEGNIIVLGSIKGFVHAGCRGNMNSFVAAITLTPTQLRIYDRITFIPAEVIKAGKINSVPSIAYVENEQIYISPIN